MKIVKRRDAKALGLVTYYNGKACPHGHVDERYTGSGKCGACAKVDVRKRTEGGYYRAYYKDNDERIRERVSGYYEANRDRALENVKEWARRNPERRRAIANSYKHRRRAQEAGGMSSSDLASWTKEQKKVCYWCGSKCASDFHVDHYVPLSKGGPHQEGNLVIACADCNRRKSARDPYQFALQVGRLL